MFLAKEWATGITKSRPSRWPVTQAAKALPGDAEQAHPGEVRRIYRDIHDRVAGAVSVALRNLELYEAYCECDPDKAHLWILRAREALIEARTSIRAIVDGTAPSHDFGGIEKALRQFAASVRPEEVTLSITVTGDESRVAPDALTEAFIVIREALRNALSHADPRNVNVVIEISDHELRATVEDDGRGFDPQRVAKRRSGVGVASMRERAARMRGRLRLTSRPGLGTRIELALPV